MDRLQYFKNKYPVNEKQVEFFVNRTNHHIDRVIKNAKRLANYYPNIKSHLLLDVRNHDSTKFSEDEYFAYVWLTSVHNLGYKYLSKELEDFVDEAWIHHYSNNPHHPEYWTVDGRYLQEMPDYQLAHMVCDWASMSQEKKNSLSSWWNSKVSKKFHFSDIQKDKIEEYISVFKELL